MSELKLRPPKEKERMLGGHGCPVPLHKNQGKSRSLIPPKRGGFGMTTFLRWRLWLAEAGGGSGFGPCGLFFAIFGGRGGFQGTE